MKNMLKEKISFSIAIFGIAAGLASFLIDWFSLDIELSPGTGINPINWLAFVGVSLISIGILAGLFWIIVKITSSKKNK